MSEWNFQDRVQVSFAPNGVAEVALMAAVLLWKPEGLFKQ